MNKLTLTITLIAITASTSFGQETRDKLNFGLKAGLNFSNIYDSQDDKFTANGKLGFAGGAFLTIPLGKTIGIQPEILYSEKGFKATGTILGSTYDLNRTTTYIDVPLLFSIKPVSIVTLLIGPQFSFLVKEKSVFSNSATSIEQEKVFNNDNVRKNTFCLTGGIDININKFIVSARAGYDLQNNNGDGTSTTPRYKNAWYQATVGFRFF